MSHATGSEPIPHFTEEVSPQYVLYQNDLSAEALASYRDSRYLAIDTETTGLNHHRDRLCLVQLTDEFGTTSLVQVATTVAPGQAPNLVQLVSDEGRQKIFHFARFDMAVLKNQLGIRFSNVFCTKIASKLVRTYTDRHGLKDLVREFVGVDLNKNEQTSYWGRTDLSSEQLAYAAGDVRYLVTLRERLCEMLEREGRMELAHACFRHLPTQVDLDLMHWSGIFDH